MVFLSYFSKPCSIKNLTFLYCCAFLLRAVVFGFFVQHEHRYWQSDSEDYHYCARGINSDNFMIFRGQPLFWRTPGFPLILSFFYWLYGATDRFAENEYAHKAFIWVQIITTSIIPLLIFFLALSLTGSLPIAWISGWISVMHVGFVLASCYVLSDAIALIFFILFLLFFYQSFVLFYEVPLPGYKHSDQIRNLLYATLFLALYTWIRPNGQFVAAVAILLLMAGGCLFRKKVAKITIFAGLFLLLLVPWCVRNYRLTGHWFYCSMSGPVLQSFTLPKVMRAVTGKDLRECFAYYMTKANQALEAEWMHLQKYTPHLYLSRELVCQKFAMAHIWSHPFIVVQEWIKEVIKTTFDLYSSQIVYILKKEHKWDPLEEVLLEKIQLCLYGQPMSFLLRSIMWLEFIYSLLLWIGIFAGCWFFLCKPLLLKNYAQGTINKYACLWIKAGFMIGSLLFMTGGYGYARLRLPADPLLIIAAVTFWYWFFCERPKAPLA